MNFVVASGYPLFLIVMPGAALLSALSNQPWLLWISSLLGVALCLIIGCLAIQAVWTWLQEKLTQSSPVTVWLVVIEGLVLLAGIWLLGSAGMRFISQ